jgi:hypothetical protein
MRKETWHGRNDYEIFLRVKVIAEHFSGKFFNENKWKITAFLGKCNNVCFMFGKTCKIL